MQTNIILLAKRLFTEWTCPLWEGSVDILTCQSRKRAGESNFINYGSVPLDCPGKPCYWANMDNTRALEQAHLKGMHLLLMLLITPCCGMLKCLLWDGSVGCRCQEKSLNKALCFVSNVFPDQFYRTVRQWVRLVSLTWGPCGSWSSWKSSLPPPTSAQNAPEPDGTPDPETELTVWRLAAPRRPQWRERTESSLDLRQRQGAGTCFI